MMNFSEMRQFIDERALRGQPIRCEVEVSRRTFLSFRIRKPLHSSPAW